MNPRGGSAPVLVLGLGNLLMRDDGVGLTMLERLRERWSPDPRIEFVDGGTQGLALLGRITSREALLVLDAIELGAAPGTVHRIDEPFGVAPPRATSAHEANAGELLRAALLLGELPPHIVLVGIEPEDTRLNVGLTPRVAESVSEAVSCAADALTELCAKTIGGVEPCTR